VWGIGFGKGNRRKSTAEGAEYTEKKGEEEDHPCPLLEERLRLGQIFGVATKGVSEG
jgi:hypothetical protein